MESAMREKLTLETMSGIHIFNPRISLLNFSGEDWRYLKIILKTEEWLNDFNIKGNTFNYTESYSLNQRTEFIEYYVAVAYCEKLHMKLNRLCHHFVSFLGPARRYSTEPNCCITYDPFQCTIIYSSRLCHIHLFTHRQ